MIPLILLFLSTSRSTLTLIEYNDDVADHIDHIDISHNMSMVDVSLPVKLVHSDGRRKQTLHHLGMPFQHTTYPIGENFVPLIDGPEQMSHHLEVEQKLVSIMMKMMMMCWNFHDVVHDVVHMQIGQDLSRNKNHVPVHTHPFLHIVLQTEADTIETYLEKKNDDDNYENVVVVVGPMFE